MLTVKELIEKLQGLDPNAFVVIPGLHLDGYDELIWPSDGIKLLSLQERGCWYDQGQFKEVDFEIGKSFYAYCL